MLTFEAPWTTRNTWGAPQIFSRNVRHLISDPVPGALWPSSSTARLREPRSNMGTPHILMDSYTYIYTFIIYKVVVHIWGGLYFPPRAAHTAHGEARCPAAADAAERRGVDGALLRATSVRAVQWPYLGDARAVAHLVRVRVG